MSDTELLQPVLSGGIANTNFFNGRLLTAEDLAAEQAAGRAQRRQLGRTLGEGVVIGLDVAERLPPSEDRPAVTVSAGLALNRLGEAVALATGAEVALVRSESPLPREAGLFAQCQPPQTAFTNTGLYVLTVMPGSGFSKERAPMVELGREGVATGCGSRYAIEGVKFNLVELPAALREPLHDLEAAVDAYIRRTGSLPARGSKELSKLRSAAAYLCFGGDTLGTDPLRASTPGYGAVDKLHEAGLLCDSEVPIALLSWTRAGIAFVDTWSVRRPVAAPPPAPRWSGWIGGRRLAESLAMFFQFQTHIEQLVNDSAPGTLPSLRVSDYFLHLPPAGFVPIRGAGAQTGLVADTFFGNLSSGGSTTIADAAVPALLDQAFLQGPVEVSGTARVQLYRIAENQEAVEKGKAAQHAMLFVTRETHGFAEDDSVKRTFQSAGDAYHGLLKKRVFLPTLPLTQPGDQVGLWRAIQDTLGGIAAVRTAIQHVVLVAAQKAGLAAARRLNRAAALDALKELYDAELEMAELLLEQEPGSEAIQFARILRRRLTESMKLALDGHDLRGAVGAQDSINHYVATYTGEGAAIGYIQVEYRPGGPQYLVPGSTSKYPFRVYNWTDKLLRFSLSVVAEGSKGIWDRVDIVDDRDKSWESILLASKASKDLFASVEVPGDADEGDKVKLAVTASLPPPHNQTVTEEKTLEVKKDAGEVVQHEIKFQNVTKPNLNLDHLGPGVVAPFELDAVLFTAAGVPEITETFRFTAKLDAPAAEVDLWSITVEGQQVTAEGGGVYTFSVDLSSGVAKHLKVKVKTPARGAADRRAKLTIKAESTKLLTPTSATTEEFAMRVRKPGS